MPTEIAALALFTALLFYSLSGGPDFGAGVWYLLSAAQKKEQENHIITKAIEPIWEANHVWLIVAVVILFTAYPEVFSFLCTKLNVALSLMLIGIVMRGSAFVFRKYYPTNAISVWDVVFIGASIVTPLLLGMIAGAVTSANFTFDSTNFWSSYIEPWTTPYCIFTGCFALVLFAFLASTYLTADAIGMPSSQKYFRNCAIFSNCAVIGLITLLCFYSQFNSYSLWHRFCLNTLAMPLIICFLIITAVVFLCLYQGRYKIARIAGATEAGLILVGIAVAQFPFLVPPNMSIYNCAANETTLRLLITALACGAVVLFPSLYVLFKVFKGQGKNSILDKQID